MRAASGKVPPEALKWRPAEGKWSAHEVVCHCADSETNAYAAHPVSRWPSPNPTILGYDEAQWARTFDYHAAPARACARDRRGGPGEHRRRCSAPVDRGTPGRPTGTHTESGPLHRPRTGSKIYAEHLEKHSRPDRAQRGGLEERVGKALVPRRGLRERPLRPPAAARSRRGARVKPPREAPGRSARPRRAAPMRSASRVRKFVIATRSAERPFRTVGARKNAPSPTRRLMILRLSRSSSASERARSVGR